MQIDIYDSRMLKGPKRTMCIKRMGHFVTLFENNDQGFT